MKEKLQSGFNNDWISSVSICATKACISVCMLFFVSWPFGETLRRVPPVAASTSKGWWVCNKKNPKTMPFAWKTCRLKPSRPRWRRDTYVAPVLQNWRYYCFSIKHNVAFIVVYFHFLIFRRCYNLFSELWLICSNKWMKQIWVIFKT